MNLIFSEYNIFKLEVAYKIWETIIEMSRTDKGFIDGWIVRWVNGWVDEWINGWIDKQLQFLSVCFLNKIRACILVHLVMCNNWWPSSVQGFPGQEYWKRLPFPPLEGVPDPGIEPECPVSPVSADGFFTTVPPHTIPINSWDKHKINTISTVTETLFRIEYIIFSKTV